MREPWIDETGVAHVPLTKGKEALVDAADLPLIAGGLWSCGGGEGDRCYAARKERRNGKPRVVFMHRVILGASQDEAVDHVNGDRLDNRRANLRIAAPHENARNRGMYCRNTSGFKGVSWKRRERKWEAYLTLNYKKATLGKFDTPEAAAIAYDRAATTQFGAFAKTNASLGRFEAAKTGKAA